MPVLREISLTLATGALTAILGPNGGGKTTLLHVLLGWLKPRSGALLVNDRSLASFSHRERSRLLGLVPQSEFIPFEFTLLEYVLLGRAPYLGPLEMPGGRDVDEARRALARVGLTSLSERPVTHMSGGERQLAMIARALAQQPAILLLDEPTSHLDLANRRRVRDVLRQLVADGITVVCTTHDPALAADMADALILMRAGEIVAAGPIENTLTSEKLSATYDLPVKARRVEGEWLITS
ncbi:MAG: ABC transporter ATP-binding protein [Verrucomicrobia bacterium]|nr:ABC transporter ATP-binding protein [Verrucomicrobiota bacterium]